MYQKTKELLEHAGYYRYEISNYAKIGKECRHNLGYWERKEYLGLGLGAASLKENIRYKNTDNLEYYLAHSNELDEIQEEKQALTISEQIEEFFFLGLRKMEGVSFTEFAKMFGKKIEECYGTQIASLMKENLLQRQDDRVMLTSKGIDVSNYVFVKLLQ